MSSSSDSQCANLDRINQLSSPIFQASCIFAAISCVFTFIVSFYAMKHIIHKSIFHSSTKILLISNILYALGHQFSWLQVSTSFIYRAIFKINKPCELMYSPSDCSPYSFILMTSISGMVFVQTGLMIERACATFLPNYSRIPKKLPGLIIGLIVAALSLSSYSFVTWHETEDDVRFSCGYYPAKSRERANLMLSIFGFLTLFNLITTLAILRYNSAFEYQNRFDLLCRFEVKETIDATRIICVLTLSEFFAHFVYSFGILLVRLNRNGFEKHNYTIVLSLFYTLPYGALLVPVLLIIRITKLRKDRQSKIQKITRQTQTTEEHMRLIQKIWNL
ncbi:unnamed protein product [Caenorhabditis angaria]|uniref:Uncharacterized protein n=1 Tax=Caenorhabditis angaria TaxID=860376 RepID=A0A9P1I960_9PELO|nr:unnamed protein product [Caenorhabditis angaria]